MTTIVGGICPRCGEFHDLFLAVDGSIVCRNADGSVERVRQLEADLAAARAEVEFWKTLSQCNADMAAGFLAARDAARAEVAALRKQEWAAPYRREVLADLRAKVEGLGLCIEPDGGEDECFCNDVALYAANRTLDKVLALIEEADRG